MASSRCVILLGNRREETNLNRNDWKLYGILGASGNPHDTLRMVEQTILGGMTMFQLREKSLAGDELLRIAREIRTLCGKHGVPFIVNDSVEICLWVGASGVHLGQEDGSIREARRILGDSCIIGATAHNLEEALRAEAEGADYLGSGAAFGSKTKKVSGAIDLREYNRIAERVKIPVVAIGGIQASNIEQLYGRGLAGVAVISGIFGDESTTLGAIQENARLLRVLAERL